MRQRVRLFGDAKRGADISAMRKNGVEWSEISAIEGVDVGKAKDLEAAYVAKMRAGPKPQSQRNTLSTANQGAHNMATYTRTKQAADHFQISTMTLYRWSKRAGFPQPLRQGQVILYDVAAITAWLQGGDK